jgi:hypothetical protein
VKHDDVTHAQPSLEPDPSWLERALVDTLLEAAELPVVAGISVQQVVDALGDPKNAGPPPTTAQWRRFQRRASRA